MKRTKLAIIGNGMATGKLLEELDRRHAFANMDVSVFGEEPHGAYNRIMLDRILKGGNVGDILLKPEGWHQDRGIMVYKNAQVTLVSPAAKRLWTEDGTEHLFDKLVFATGSKPRLPQMEGLKDSQGKLVPGVCAYRDVSDCQKMKDYALKGGNAVVIGGGLLGLEAAKGLSDLGMRVNLTHIFETLMNRQLDRMGGQMLGRAMERLGIGIRTGVLTKGIVFGPKNKVIGVRLADGEILDADLVVLAIGIQPRATLAQESDIPVNAGILVNDQLWTGIEGVFALGECAEHRGITHGTIQPIYEQCSVLADVLTGNQADAAYLESKTYTKLKVAGVEVASMGINEPAELDDEVVQVVEEKRGIYRKLIIRDGRLAGAVLVGDTGCAPALARRFERQDLMPANRLDALATPFRAAESGGMICHCNRVTEEVVLNQIRVGCRTLQEITAKTGAGSGCGSCRGQLASLLLKNSPVKSATVSV